MKAYIGVDDKEKRIVFQYDNIFYSVSMHEDAEGSFHFTRFNKIDVSGLTEIDLADTAAREIKTYADLLHGTPLSNKTRTEVPVRSVRRRVEWIVGLYWDAMKVTNLS